jgi:hypothetical protein
MQRRASKARMVRDALDDLIEAKRREHAALRAEFEAVSSRLAVLEHDLKTLEHAAELRPVANRRPARIGVGSEARISAHKGRQLGAISQEWRQILRRIAVHYPDGALAEEIASYGPMVGLPNLRPTDARQRAEKYIEYGYLEQVGDRYKATDLAFQKFGTVESDPAPAVQSTPVDGQRRIFPDAA